jgi:hypothetical protein
MLVDPVRPVPKNPRLVLELDDHPIERVYQCTQVTGCLRCDGGGVVLFAHAQRLVIHVIGSHTTPIVYRVVLYYAIREITGIYPVFSVI